MLQCTRTLKTELVENLGKYNNFIHFRNLILNSVIEEMYIKTHKLTHKDSPIKIKNHGYITKPTSHIKIISNVTKKIFRQYVNQIY